MDPSQEAFQAYMLGSKAPSSLKTPTPSKASSTPSSSSRKGTKRFGPIVAAFRGRVEEWVQTDNQLNNVLNSILNLRNRIWWERKKLEESNRKQDSWNGAGFRRSNHSFLLQEDLESALSHDLLQHEKMLAGARTLISSMAQAQDGMGRRLDEFFQMETLSNNAQNVLDAMLQVFHFLGEELYRKQCLVSRVIDSCNDGLLVDGLQEEKLDGNPRSVAKQCYNGWLSRNTRKNEWDVVDRLLGG
mmetsp:Transcript_24477/g.59943  ORF Transcript_24477/g.59943 Transcript_24477/m.59943 type:complete len:244 (+) Transcript_24477:338-1069(+)|eukprot:CAMPEP_0113621136 /NCGR_PEP_ID=MMETSP0017_2-20120614/10793_1 /TAXON_ID=2856 /ORGANISM="Cylindrotheca closterium" /LENGTH=243 /DNA_ID=CAMNT_0000530859 /DNA_START=328 /DNA_END=1059 /DNA_ORIENTATION=+ /assembly_acc=CAM_ASM_000147